MLFLHHLSQKGDISCCDLLCHSGRIGKQCGPLTAHLALLHISTRWQCLTHTALFGDALIGWFCRMSNCRCSSEGRRFGGGDVPSGLNHAIFDQSRAAWSHSSHLGGSGRSSSALVRSSPLRFVCGFKTSLIHTSPLKEAVLRLPCGCPVRSGVLIPVWSLSPPITYKSTKDLMWHCLKFLKRKSAKYLFDLD